MRVCMHEYMHVCICVLVSTNNVNQTTFMHACMTCLWAGIQCFGEWDLGLTGFETWSHIRKKYCLFFYSKSLSCAKLQSISMFLHVYMCEYSFCIRVGSREDRVRILVCQCTIRFNKTFGWMDAWIHACMKAYTSVYVSQICRCTHACTNVCVYMYVNMWVIDRWS